MSITTLPADFSDLEAYAEWSLEHRRDRFKKRLSSSMEKITAFYNAMVPRIDSAVKYLNSKPLAALDESEKRLLAMCLSLIEVSRCIERWDAPDSGAFGADKLVIEL
jgi:hypothetical protein